MSEDSLSGAAAPLKIHFKYVTDNAAPLKSNYFLRLKGQPVFIRVYNDIIAVLAVAANEHLSELCLHVLLQITLDRTRAVMRIIGFFCEMCIRDS